MVKKLALALGLVSLLAHLATAQAKEITSEEYNAPLRAALQKARGLTRRVNSVTFSYKDKVTDSDDWMYEYVLPDKVRYVHTETIAGKVRRTEQIDIGQTQYCKKDDGAWQISKGYCIGGSGSGGPSNIVSTKYSVEEVNLNPKRITIFRSYTTYKNVHSPNKETEGLSFWYSNYWLDEEGKLLRQETKVGLVKSEKLRWKAMIGYIYDDSIKILAPIK